MADEQKIDVKATFSMGKALTEADLILNQYGSIAGIINRDVTVVLEECQRQMVLKSLAHLACQYRGWFHALNEIALKMDNVKDGKAQLFYEFWQIEKRRSMKVRLVKTKEK